jgi:HPt (histidine-containing phosphotransfer) domain-containing protein
MATDDMNNPPHLERLDGLDVPRALEFLDGDAALLSELLATFMVDAPGELRNFQQALQSRDETAVQKYLHRAAPTLAIIASEGLANDARKAHEQLRAGKQTLEELAPSLGALALCMDKLLTQAQAWLAQNPGTPFQGSR